MRLFIYLFMASMLSVLSTPSFAELKTGVAKADLTPANPVGCEMAGYGARGKARCQGVHDPIQAKAIVLDDGTTKLAIVTLDLVGISVESAANVKAEVKRAGGPKDILLITSHTHSGPTADENWPSKEHPWIRETEKKIAGAIMDAAEHMKPAKIGIGWGEVREGHNRRFVNPDGTVTMLWANRNRIATHPLDYQLGAILVDGADGKPIATLVNFQCHPVVLGPENLLISADYVGVFTKTVEEAGGGQCMFIQGAAGDINPFWDKTPPSEGAYEQAEIMGKTVAKEVLRVRETVKEFDAAPAFSIHTELVPLQKRWDLNNPDVQGAIKKAFGDAGLERYKSRYGADLVAEVNTILIGKDLAIASFPGEFFLEHGLALKSRSPVKNTIFAGYCNGLLGYFPTIKAASEGGYGAMEATIVEVGAGEKLVNRALVDLYYQTGKLKAVPSF